MTAFQRLQASLAYSFLFTLLYCAGAFAVPAVPNEAVMTGTVIEYCITSSGGRTGPLLAQSIYKIFVKVDTGKSRGDAPNFLEGKEGRKIYFWSRNRIDPELFGKKIRAVVEYRGDERGGKFFIKKIEPIR
jgi:hypothetical protein